MTRNFILTVEKSSGNDTVGDMWKETYVFDENTTIGEAIDQIFPERKYQSKRPRIKQNVTITDVRNQDWDEEVLT